MSGAGRSTAATSSRTSAGSSSTTCRPGCSRPWSSWAAAAAATVPRIAVVVDVRGGQFFADLRDALADLEAAGVRPRILFLEASDEALVRRFEAPAAAPAAGQRGPADRRHRRRARAAVATCAATPTWSSTPPRSTSTSCAPRSRPPSAATTTASLRIATRHVRLQVRPAGRRRPRRRLPLPAQPALGPRAARPQTGLDPDGAATTSSAQPGANEFLDSYAACWTSSRPGYLREGKRYVTVAVGCTGGKHRSVAMAEDLAAGCEADRGRVVHRDLGRVTATCGSAT